MGRLSEPYARSLPATGALLAADNLRRWDGQCPAWSLLGPVSIGAR